MTRTYYHGTSADNLEDILKNGLHGNTDKLWSCSGREVYMWDVEKLAIAEGNEDNLNEWKEQSAYSRASESGQIACAVATDCRVVVLKIRMDDKNVWDDVSCDNMDGAVATIRVLPRQIKEIHVSNDLSLVKGFMMRMVDGMDLWNREFDKVEQMIVDKLKNVEWYPEDMESIIRWEQLKGKHEYTTI